MAKTKLKTSSVKKPKAVLKLPSRKPLRAEESAVWQSELALLQSKVFSSLEQALEQLIDGVVTRLGSAGPRAAAERDFVRLLMETDPGLMQSLKNSVKIK